MSASLAERVRSTGAVIGQAVVTAVVGLIAIRLAGGPNMALIVQAGALIVGALIALGLAINPWRPAPKWAAVLIGVCLALLFATLGDAGPGVHRWIAAGPIVLQPASILLPFVVWALAVARANWWAGALAGAFALVLAIQPDAASATALLLALIGLAAVRGRVAAPDVTALLMALAATVWSWTRVDPLPAVAHVERVVPEAFAANPVVGIAAGLMLILLPLPFVVRALTGGERALAAGLAGLWIGLVAGNLFGNYPAPVVGYGASLVVGWLASLGLVLARARPVPAPQWTIHPRER
ncbi:putative peptidoglycan glycosyltransferase FtsW/RodA [Brevundimonas goettingensis]|uniref:FtsW/RodA/SpoVE family cell cycle protein n=1 Tax=Brevundimonas goettingensis TaxID=2774190 RepID=A0A975C1Y4_9CAUL|nr:FtsW/RodA/SpoVE family cell cycle protein [Brevundimonas goettingensis]QTC91382.1 FtsW/RodA/SpoVE family cell cycle protein [Brevundimonas goettingensis]